MLGWLTRWLRRPPRRPAGPRPRPIARASARGSQPALPTLRPHGPAGAARLEVPGDDHALVALLELPLGAALPADEVADVEARIRGMVYRGTIAVPPFPAAAARVLELVERPDLDVNELVRVLHWEPAVVAEIVVTANTAAYASGARGAPLDDLRSAVITLGLQQVGAIAAAVSARALFEDQAKAEFDLYPALWRAAHREAMVVAFTASWLAQALRAPRYDRVFLRAVIGGVGRTIALKALAQQLLDGRCPRLPAEAVIAAGVDATHRDATASAIAGWDLPASVTHVIDPTNHTERAIVDLVATLVELRRAPALVGAAARTRALVAELQLDASWLRVVLHELDAAAARVDAMLAARALR